MKKDFRNVLIVSILLATIVLLLLEMGSGIVPLPFSILVLGAVLGAVLANSPILLAKRSPKLRFVLGIPGCLGTIVLAGVVFGYFQTTGFEVAKSYAADLALVIDENRQGTESYPDVSTIPATELPSVDTPWPYSSSCEGGVCSRIAGYFIAYDFGADGPELAVGRRDISVRWDWDSMAWVN